MLSIRTFRLVAIAGAWAAFVLSNQTFASADGNPPTASISGPEAPARIPVSSRTKAAGTTSESSGGWWLGSIGITAALAIFGHH